MNGRQLSWKEANQSCGAGGLLKLSQNDGSLSGTLNLNLSADHIIKWNVPYWLGLQKAGTCINETAGHPSNISQVEMKKCPYAESSVLKFANCGKKVDVVCVKPGKLIFNNLIFFRYFLIKAGIILYRMAFQSELQNARPFTLQSERPRLLPFLLRSHVVDPAIMPF